MFDQGRSEADCRGRLSDAALLVADDENCHSIALVTRETLHENWVKLGAEGGVFVPSILADEGLADHIAVGFRQGYRSHRLRPFSIAR